MERRWKGGGKEGGGGVSGWFRETDCPAGLSVLFQGSVKAPRWRPQINVSLRLA